MNRRGFFGRLFGGALAAVLPWSIRSQPNPRTLCAADITSLVNDTLREMGRPQWNEIAADLQRGVAFRRLIDKVPLASDKAQV